jgi:hypothetical protein
MEINELTPTQLTIMVKVVSTTPLFSVATIPRMHQDFLEFGEGFANVKKDTDYLASLGFVKEITDEPGEHKKITEAIEKATGYKYNVYAVTELGLGMFQGYVDDLTKEMKYRNSIN